ncbi:sensor histidine kinase [Dysgonomonas sp. ZJ709]|uniref:sensor histidine kinase n=1 Tax=Dysgonomonas sp. ZJ709 TaxID=2709797 RepID=UPI0013EC5535|nr:sensor histidine kinase [Dysgonomonas sp. ZJ709]
MLKIINKRMPETNIEKQSYLYKVLIDPSYRIWRYALLILAFGIMAINKTLVNFKGILPELGNKVYIVAGLIFTTYMTIIFLNRYSSKYLLKKKYIVYVLLILFITFCFMVIQNCMEYLILLNYGVELNYSFLLLDNISSYIVYLICFAGMSIPVFLKHWMEYNKRVNQLENNKIYSEVELLKEQISPILLFNILNRTGVLAKNEPERASNMLMKLSQLLRYQLYDCNREKVLLSSEITFLKNYLELEQLYSPLLHFSLNSEGDFYGRFVPPLIFLPFIQLMVNSTKQEGKGLVEVSISAHQDEVLLECTVNNVNIGASAPEYQKAVQRLDMLYKKSYSLSLYNNEDANQTIVSLKIN